MLRSWSVHGGFWSVPDGFWSVLLGSRFSIHDLDDADAFSRAPSEENADNIDIPDIEGEVNLHLNAIMQHLPASDARLIEIRTQTEKDETLKELSRVINEGWPNERKQCDDRIKMYWDYRTDLSLFDGLILKDAKL